MPNIIVMLHIPFFRKYNQSKSYPSLTLNFVKAQGHDVASICRTSLDKNTMLNNALAYISEDEILLKFSEVDIEQGHMVLVLLERSCDKDHKFQILMIHLPFFRKYSQIWPSVSNTFSELETQYNFS